MEQPIGVWLAQHGLAKYTQFFEGQGLDTPELLALLTEEEKAECWEAAQLRAGHIMRLKRLLDPQKCHALQPMTADEQLAMSVRLVAAIDRLGLRSCLPALVENGFDHEGFLLDLSPDEVVAVIAILKLPSFGARARFRKLLLDLRGTQQNSQSSSSPPSSSTLSTSTPSTSTSTCFSSTLSVSPSCFPSASSAVQPLASSDRTEPLLKALPQLRSSSSPSPPPEPSLPSLSSIAQKQNESHTRQNQTQETSKTVQPTQQTQLIPPTKPKQTETTQQPLNDTPQQRTPPKQKEETHPNQQTPPKQTEANKQEPVETNEEESEQHYGEDEQQNAEQNAEQNAVQNADEQLEQTEQEEIKEEEEEVDAEREQQPEPSPTSVPASPRQAQSPTPPADASSPAPQPSPVAPDPSPQANHVGPAALHPDFVAKLRAHSLDNLANVFIQKGIVSEEVIRSLGRERTMKTLELKLGPRLKMDQLLKEIFGDVTPEVVQQQLAPVVQQQPPPQEPAPAVAYHLPHENGTPTERPPLASFFSWDADEEDGEQDPEKWAMEQFDDLVGMDAPDEENVKKLKLVLSFYPELANRPNDDGIPPLYAASIAAAVEALVEAKANVNYTDGVGGTPLMDAIRFTEKGTRDEADYGMMEALLRCNADPNLVYGIKKKDKWGGLTALQKAVRENDERLMSILLRGGAQVILPSGQSALTDCEQFFPAAVDIIRRFMR